jgi:hypothetical protein
MAYFMCLLFAGLGVWLSFILESSMPFICACGLDSIIITVDYFKWKNKTKGGDFNV